MGTTEMLARFAVECAPDHVTAKARDGVRRSLIDMLGTTLAGTLDPTGKVITQFVVGQRAAGSSWIAGRSERTSPMLAALANGTMAHALDYDDYFAFGHAAVAIVPATLAIAEEVDASGGAFLDALVIGYEIAGRISAGATEAPYTRGYHGTALYGVFGATATAGRLLGLDVGQMRQAFGIAGSLVSGVRANFGTDTKPLHAGECNRQGVEAAKLAMAGFTADPNILETPLGYGEALLWRGEFDQQKMVENLGRPFIAEQGPDLKKYPCCYYAHSTLDAMYTILNERSLTADDITKITVDGPPTLKDPLIYVQPRIGLHGKFSLHYNIALALVDGRNSLGSYTDDHIRDARLAEVIDKVEVNTHDGWPSMWTARVDVTLNDGSHVVQDQPFIRGDAAHPLSWEEILEKYRDNASVVLQPAAVDRSIEMIEGLEKVPTVRTLVGELANLREGALAV